MADVLTDYEREFVAAMIMVLEYGTIALQKESGITREEAFDRLDVATSEMIEGKWKTECKSKIQLRNLFSLAKKKFLKGGK